MEISKLKFQVRNKKASQISIATMIDQSKFQLIGGIFSDKNGKIHFVELVHLPSGQIVVDFPKNIEILDAMQVGVSF